MADKNIKFDCEFEITPLRFASVLCPACSKKFDAMAHGKTDRGSYISDAIDLHYAIFRCPHCTEEFTTRGLDIEIGGKQAKGGREL